MLDGERAGAQAQLASDDMWVGYVLTFAVGAVGFLLYLTRRAWAYLVLGVMGVTVAVPEALIDWTEGTLGTAAALLAARRRSSRLRLLILAGVGFGLLEFLVSFAPSVWLFSLLLLPIGMLGMTTNISANTSVQMAADPKMRGRVMSLYMMVFVGGTPVGAPLIGALAEAFGPRSSIIAGGVVTALSGVVAAVVMTRVRSLKVEAHLVRRRPHVHVRRLDLGVAED